VQARIVEQRCDLLRVLDPQRLELQTRAKQNSMVLEWHVDQFTTPAAKGVGHAARAIPYRTGFRHGHYDMGKQVT